MKSAITLLRSWKLCVLLAAIAAFYAGIAGGQGLTGQISGLLTDSSGAPVAGATLTIVNSYTQKTRTTHTDS
jgi:hypothetical protein